ncbi:hypothetical protein N825_29510 [Skermanella stibiiresistens SB22]|uniref:Lipoyl-binding domain-containing protein n=1 Tax=Skermanella stibiiresistens SB22 TaxID=1385369 RepID=W9GQP6_9PROT|nr:acetyl-CoA carboxylase biotin carboxyl carrier protein subunit [Skermanella stibiiresistens]EWY36195.1 hypothetical protein N825_29510 [Skermanella stibiiresistens SB22]
MTSPLDHVADIAAWFAATDLDILELTGPAGYLRLHRGGDPVIGTEPPREPTAGIEAQTLPSPGFGHFLHAHPLRETPMVEPDERVAAGRLLGFLRVGVLLVPVRAQRPGVISAILAADGALVGYGDPLFQFSSQS